MHRLTTSVLAILLVVALTACGDADADRAAPTTTSTALPSTTTTVPPLAQHGAGVRTTQLVDPSRPTAADPRGASAMPDRTLELTVYYPSDAAPAPTEDAPTGLEPVPGAPISEGRFPLVVFSHGLGQAGDRYGSRIYEWVSAGYLVVAPTFPLTSGDGARLDDYVNQPADVRFVIDEVLRRSADPADDLFHDHVDNERIALAGHSMGAMMSIAVAFNSCCLDDRIDAIVEVSGIQLDFPGGGYEDMPPIPLLAVHGGADTLVKIEGSERLVAAATGPTAFLRLPASGHGDIMFWEPGSLVADVAVAFLDRHLRGDDRRWSEIEEVTAASGLGTLLER
jgi:dienelactone hydrolase